jgi:hypothetical protein
LDEELRDLHLRPTRQQTFTGFKGHNFDAMLFNSNPLNMR